MDKASVMMFIFLSGLIIININEMRNLIMPVKKRKIEIVVLSVVILVFSIIILWYGRIWSHYIVGFLGIIYIFSSWAKRGITLKGFNSIMSLARFQRWDNIDYIDISFDDNDDFKVSYLLTHLIGKESYYYKKEDYEKVVNILSDKLPSEKIRIK